MFAAILLILFMLSQVDTTDRTLSLSLPHPHSLRDSLVSRTQASGSSSVSPTSVSQSGNIRNKITTFRHHRLELKIILTIQTKYFFVDSARLPTILPRQLLPDARNLGWQEVSASLTETLSATSQLTSCILHFQEALQFMLL